MKKPTFNQREYRFYEMLPGILSWTIILFPLWGSFFMPTVVAYFVLAFLVFWFYQSFKNAILGIIGYNKIRKTEKINWQDKYKQDRQNDWLEWDKIKHIIIIPNYNESAQKISISLQALIEQKDIDKKQITIILAMEERASDAHEKAEYLIKKYSGVFGNLVATFHPPDIVGEIKGKASNEAWAAKWAKKHIIDKNKWDLNYVTVTSCDADAKFHPKYFSLFTYHFTKTPDRYYRFWQSPIFWYNNLDKVPNLIRVVGIMGNIIHVSQLQDPDRMFFNYSTYSLSFKMLHEVGYWDTDIIPEDWHIFLQSYFANQGKVEVNPLLLPTSIDAPEGSGYFDALQNRYLQCQRHAWGATDIPYAIAQAKAHPEIPWRVKILRIAKLFETHLIWTTNWFLLTLGALLPTIVNPKFMQTSLGYNLPRFSRTILTACLVALFIIVVLDSRLRPPELKNKSTIQKIKELSQWILVPVATLFMSVIPGLDAQTRLMLGKRLEYKVTKKF